MAHNWTKTVIVHTHQESLVLCTNFLFFLLFLKSLFSTLLVLCIGLWALVNENPNWNWVEKKIPINLFNFNYCLLDSPFLILLFFVLSLILLVLWYFGWHGHHKVLLKSFFSSHLNASISALGLYQVPVASFCYNVLPKRILLGAWEYFFFSFSFVFYFRNSDYSFGPCMCQVIFIIDYYYYNWLRAMVLALLSLTELWVFSVFNILFNLLFKKVVVEKVYAPMAPATNCAIFIKLIGGFFFAPSLFLYLDFHLSSHIFHSFCYCIAMGSMARNQWSYWTIIIILQNMILQFDGYKFQIQSNYVQTNNPIKDTHRIEGRHAVDTQNYSILVSNYSMNAERWTHTRWTDNW